jgi:hypothetical protein
LEADLYGERNRDRDSDADTDKDRDRGSAEIYADVSDTSRKFVQMGLIPRRYFSRGL